MDLNCTSNAPTMDTSPSSAPQSSQPSLESRLASLKLQPQVQPKVPRKRYVITKEYEEEILARIKLQPDDWDYRGHYNARNAMRVLEDYLCAAVLGLDQSPPVYAPSRSLRKLIESGEHKESLDKVMAKYRLTKPLLQLMRSLKRNGWFFPSFNWNELVQTTIYQTDNERTRQAKIHLFDLLKTFAKGDGLEALKSPYFKDDYPELWAEPHRRKFRVW